MADVANYPVAGPVQHSTRLVQLTDAADVDKGNYVCENFSPSAKTKEITRYDQNAAPSGFALTPDFSDGSATLQIASGSVNVPLIGWKLITATAPAGTWIITSVGMPESIGTQKLYNVSFKLSTFV